VVKSAQLWLSTLVVWSVFAGAAGPVFAGELLRVYGPGGPAPAMKEAARAFESREGVKVLVTAGPSGKWMEQARNDADLIYSGSENMMTDFVWAMDGKLVESSIVPLYLRPAAILVRPGNPRGIGGFNDLLKPGVRVLVVNGAGQTGLWEDLAGRTGKIETVRALRNNIVTYARNSGEAKKRWMADKGLDVWLIWNIWQISNPELAEAIPIEAEYLIYRDTGIGLTRLGTNKAAGKKFIEFLLSKQGEKIFEHWGWTAG